ncbi:MAG: PTS sugar transporter subunit IIC [Clostridiales bacterium]|jgi:uncharacterized membrane protein|nr:PTS sugar transporter subunit IIC [Clostridiales bacterium]
MSAKTYAAKVLDGMAKGLFASLIIGTIIKQIGVIFNIQIIIDVGQVAQYFMGPAIGVGIAFARGAGTFTMISAIVVGGIGAGTVKFGEAGAVIAMGEPVGALIAALIGVEFGKFIEGKTKLDLIFVPAGIITVGGTVGIVASPLIAKALNQLGVFVNTLTNLQPIPMGILLGIVVGMVLTLPISSAALCVAINIGVNDTGTIAAGAALAGCCAQMVGFAVISWRDNKASGFFAQMLGTSMIQVPNIIKNPLIWIPPTIASGVCGLVSAIGFKMLSTSVGAGMGTSGLVGQFATYGAMGAKSLLPMLITHFLLPAVISLAAAEFMRRKNWIKEGDLAL